jgi:hypothetical protein
VTGSWTRVFATAFFGGVLIGAGVEVVCTAMKLTARNLRDEENVWRDDDEWDQELSGKSAGTRPGSDGNGSSSQPLSQQDSSSCLTISDSSTGLPDSSPVNGNGQKAAAEEPQQDSHENA